MPQEIKEANTQFLTILNGGFYAVFEAANRPRSYHDKYEHYMNISSQLPTLNSLVLGKILKKLHGRITPALFKLIFKLFSV